MDYLIIKKKVRFIFYELRKIQINVIKKLIYEGFFFRKNCEKGDF